LTGLAIGLHQKQTEQEMTFTLAPAAPISRYTFATTGATTRSNELAELDALPEGVRALAPEAFAALYRVLVDGLNSFAYSMLRDSSAAEDAVQQAFLELVKAAPTIRGDGRALRSWLFRSVRFRCLDELRRRERRRENLHADIPDHLLSSGPSPGGTGDLAAAMSELTQQQREVLFLRHVMGMSGREVANVLDTNRAAVFATAARAERRLRQILSDEGPTARRSA
jgi:RNA polymerase sigma-70 factor (ECF subfamily)